MRTSLAGLLVTGLAACGSAHPAVRSPGGRILRDLKSQDNPYLGVAWLNRQAKRVTATIAGRALELKPIREAASPEKTSFEGFLHPAGLRKGPLRVRPRPGTDLWFGDPPVQTRIQLTVAYPNGQSREWKDVVALHAGYG